MRAGGLGLLFLSAALAQTPGLQLVRVASGVTNPTDIQNAGDGTNRLFLLQQSGVIRVLSGGALLPTPFLDISSKVLSGGERGLLGLAFPPGYASKGYFYVHYDDLNGNTVIARYRVTSDPNAADPNSEAVILTVNQPFANHKGGQLRFGPDGYLYIGMGDGGSAGDPFGNGQSLKTRLGKLLRIDTENPGNAPFAIPPSNPFVNNSSALPEIWAYGLRNPWRFSFDRATHDLWIADVGQDLYEEIDFQPTASKGGENYGWNIMEGLHCYQAASCSMTGLTLPIHEYTHSDGCSVTGGFVYRGQVSPSAAGTYVYGDYCSGNIWSIQRQNNAWVNTLLLTTALSITTFGEDEAGEIYVADQKAGEIHRLAFPQSAVADASAGSVVNAASGASGIVPGAIATIYPSGFTLQPGIQSATAIPLPLSLGGLSVKVNGVSAPLFAVSNSNGTVQVNFQVPYEIAGSTTAQVTIEGRGVVSAPVQLNVLAVQPGVFSSAAVAVVVHSADNTLMSSGNPLIKGEYAYFYANGLGAVNNPPPSGQAAPMAPFSTPVAQVSVSIGGVPCYVLFDGLAPGLVGVFQINVRVPTGAPSGSQDMVVTAGGVESPPVTVFVQ